MQHSNTFGLLEVLPEIFPLINIDSKPCNYQGTCKTHYIWFLDAIF
jgi:hypothetical protein